MTVIKFQNIKKVYPGGKKALDKLNLDIQEEEILTLIGPSGCGKTTLLKMINGLILPTEGDLLVEGRPLSKWNPIKLRRRIGYVIQQVGLFPHYTIEQNISYVLKIMGEDKKHQRNRAEELIQLVGLPLSSLKQYPRELSGGQQQRIGVARALAADPPIILMDEPFGAIDEITRKTLQEELLLLQSKLKKTIVFVTHDIEEAMKLGDRVALMKEGKIEQIDIPQNMFFNPKTSFVKNFFGLKNFTSFMNISLIKEGIDSSMPYILYDKDTVEMVNKKDLSIKNYPVVNKEGIYLGIAKNMDVLKEFGTSSIIEEKPLTDTQNMMGAMRHLFEKEKNALPVVNKEKKYLGVFSIENAYSPIFSKYNKSPH